jgi:hypothetical protein
MFKLTDNGSNAIKLTSVAHVSYIKITMSCRTQIVSLFLFFTKNFN